MYAGNHGLEIFYPNGTSYNHQIPTDVSDNYSKLVKELEETVSSMVQSTFSQSSSIFRISFISHFENPETYSVKGDQIN